MVHITPIRAKLGSVPTDRSKWEWCESGKFQNLHSFDWDFKNTTRWGKKRRRRKERRGVLEIKQKEIPIPGSVSMMTFSRFESGICLSFSISFNPNRSWEREIQQGRNTIPRERKRWRLLPLLCLEFFYLGVVFSPGFKEERRGEERRRETPTCRFFG